MTPSIEWARRNQQNALETRFGPWPRAHLRLEADVHFFNDVVQNKNRMGEVILVLRRSDGKALLHTKTFYPDGIYRLPSGGIQGDEPVIDAAKREAAEETGLALNGPRLLGLITYDLHKGEEQACFHSWVVTASVVGEAKSSDPCERIEGYRWVAVDRLPQVAADLRNLPEDWNDWGHFRALAHDLVSHWIEEVEDA